MSTSFYSDVVTTHVNKDTMVQHSMAHEPVGVVYPFLYNIWSISISWEGPGQFQSKKYSL